MIIAFISNPLNFFPLFALAGNKRNLILVINTSNYPKNINRYLNIKRDQFRTRLICLPFIISRAIIKSKFIIKTLLYINEILYKKYNLHFLSIAVPTLAERPLSFLYEDTIKFFKSLKIYEYGDFIGVECSLKSLNKDHWAFQEQYKLLSSRRRKLNSQLINSSLFKKIKDKTKLNKTNQSINYINLINSLVKDNKALNIFLEKYILKKDIQEKEYIYIIVLRSVGRKDNQSIFEPDEFINIKKDSKVIVRPHPRDLINKSKLIKSKLKKQINTLKICLNKLEIVNVSFDNYAFVPLEILKLHSFYNGYFIKIIGKESGIVLNVR